MRIILVGPTHPFKGGVAAHTTSLAHRLTAAGHEVALEGWSRLYPAWLYPGELTVPGGEPDVTPFAGAPARLRWDRPGSWWAVGRQARRADLVVLVCAVPAQVPALAVIARAARGGRPAPRIVAIVHNVAPHESHPGAGGLISALLRRLDGVVVHSAAQAKQAGALGAARVAWAPLPAHLPGGAPPSEARVAAVEARLGRADGVEPVRVLALGLVRAYKGFDLLLSAAAEVPGVAVTVAGELWGGAGAAVIESATDPRLAGRVEIRPGYLPGPAIAAICAEHDVLALPYRSATGTQNVLLARAHGLPVLASAITPFTTEVRDGIDGLLVSAGDVPALVEGLTRLGAPGVLTGLIKAVPTLDVDGAWSRYLDTLIGDLG